MAKTEKTIANHDSQGNLTGSLPRGKTAPTTAPRLVAGVWVPLEGNKELVELNQQIAQFACLRSDENPWYSVSF